MKGYRILVVDDDPVQQALLAEYLGLSGYDVISAGDGAEGLELVQTGRPDLVLLDVQMPVMDGFRCLEEMKKLPGFRDTPVLFLTSLDKGHLKVRGLELGAEDYITKPFNKAELLARVRNGLRRAERYRKIEGALEGDFADVGPEELLQTLQIGRKRARVRLKDCGGEILVDGGRFLGASWGAFAGREALVRLLYLARGAFAVDFGDLPEDAAEIGEAPEIEHVLVEALVALDEARRALAGLPPGETLIEIDEAAEAASLAALRSLSPLPLRDLLVLMAGDLKDNAGIIAAAFGQGRLKEAR